MREVTEVDELPPSKRKWDWESLLNGKIWELTIEDLEAVGTKDFDNNFRPLAHHHAKKRGLAVTCRTIEKNARGMAIKVWMQAKAKD